MNHLLKVLLNIASCTINPFIWLHCFIHTLKPKYQKVHYYILAFLGLFSFLLLLNFFTPPTWLSCLFFPVILLYTMGVSKLLFHESSWVHLKIFLLLYTLSLVVDGGTYFFIYIANRTIFDYMKESPLIASIFYLISQSINLILYFIIFSVLGAEKIKSKYESIYATAVYGFVSIVVLTVSIYSAKQNGFNQNSVYVLHGILVTIKLLFVIYVIFLIIQKTKNEYENQMKLLDTKLKMYRRIEDVTNEMRLVKHDLKSHLMIIKHLNEEDKKDEISTYIDQIIETAKLNEIACASENWVLSAVINETLRLTNEYNIQFSWNILVGTLPFNDLDTNSLFSNLLNNAVEAALKIIDPKKRFIELDVISRFNIIEISCRNTYSTKPAINHRGDFLTTKGDSTRHGLGTKIIKKIIRKYNGDIENFFKDDFFITKITILKGD